MKRLPYIYLFLPFYLVLLFFDKTQTEKSENDVVVLTVATKVTDGYLRYLRSAKIYGIPAKTLGLGSEWFGGSMKSTGGGQKINLFRKELEKYKDDKEKIVLFTDSYDVIFLTNLNEILNQFHEIGGRVVFGAEPFCWPDKTLASQYPHQSRGKQYLNSGGIIGYAAELYRILSYKTIKDEEDDQLFYTLAYLNETMRKELDIKLDHKSQIFHNINGALEELSLKFRNQEPYLENKVMKTSPLIIHGNGPVNSKVDLNNLGNYLPKVWSSGEGCLACKENVIALPGKEAEYPEVFLALFVSKPSPFFEDFLKKVVKLKYPKNKIQLFIYNNIVYHEAEVEKFVEKYKQNYKSLKQIKPSDEIVEAHAKALAVEQFLSSNADYYMNLDSDAHLDNPHTLKLLIEQNRTIVAPMLVRPYKAWSNFWGNIAEDGFYSRSFDYMDIVNNEKRGLWNVPYISGCYLINGTLIRNEGVKPNYVQGSLDPDMAFCHHMREKGIFMYVSNRVDFGHLVNPETFDITRTHPDFYQIFDNKWDWEQRYLHENYTENLNPDTKPLMPCPDVYWFPVASPRFCKELIEICESYGKWSDGSNKDPRLDGGYENVPTRDIHMKQLGLEYHWLYFLKQYVRPLQEHVYTGYFHNDDRLEGGYEAVPTRDIHMNQVGLEKQWLHFLAKYVAPLNYKVYTGYQDEPPRAIMNFVVRYKPNEQPSLRPHHDSSTYTINIALNTPKVDYEEIAGVRSSKRTSGLVANETELTHSSNYSEGGQRLKLDSGEDHGGKHEGVGRTESPDNDSAFSDNVSMLSSESSASSGGSSGASKTSSGLGIEPHPQNETVNRAKAEKIRIALEKMKLASVKKLFIKAFTSDGSTKSLLVDEKMTCGFVTRLLADKNHVTMEPKWAIVEHLPDLYMERVYEDHELLVDNLMMWTRDSKNKIIFNERVDKYQLFATPEAFLLSQTDVLCDYDDHSRAMLLEEFFSGTSNTVPEISGPLYLKSDSKKGWKKFHFVLRASGLYYYPKEKSKSSKDLVCLTSFDINEVYYGIGWKKKFKSPTDFCFAIKHPRLQQPKSTKYIKYLCADDNITLQKWVVGIRIAKYNRQLLENYRSLLDDLAQEDLDLLAHARSCSVVSIAQTSQSQTPDRYLPNYDLTKDLSDLQGRSLTRRDSINGREGESMGSSSSSSGCLSDGASCVEQGFECDFPSAGTIKRKPSMNPKLPLTSMTRQLKEVGEAADTVEAGTRSRSENEDGKLSRSGTLTKNSVSRQSWRRSQTSDDSGSNSGTLKRKRSFKKDRKTTDVLDNRLPGSETHKTTAEEFNALGNRLTLEEVSRSLNEVMNTLLTQTESICREESSSVFEDALERNLENVSDNASSFGDEEDKLQNNELEDFLPPPAEMFESTLSLSSLPPPPSQSELPVFDENELSCSSLSLASLPPFPTTSPRVSSPKSDLSTPTSSGGATPVNALSPDLTPTNRSPALSPPSTYSPKVPPKPVRQIINKNNINSSPSPYYSQIQKVEAPSKNSPKKISFSFIVEEMTDSSAKPLPPKRSESTRLTSPKKIASKESTLTPPPKEFLKDLQRVMKKKWQVAQKCKLDSSTTPHEVLGFRDPPPPVSDYKETNVSNWVKEHYGNVDNLYENVYLVGGEGALPAPNKVTKIPPPIPLKPPLAMLEENAIYHSGGGERHVMGAAIAGKKRPPPPPPKRSETTHLSTRYY